MKILKILASLLLLTTFCFGQNFKPSYQSNSSLDFSKFLSGVKYAYILLKENHAKEIIANPNNGLSNAISGLVMYLKEIGFEDVEWGSVTNPPKDLPSLCELSIIMPSWDNLNNTLTNVNLSFVSCKGDIFTFKSTNDIPFDQYTSIHITFHNVFMKMYGYKKGQYSVYNRLSLSSEMTEWSEESLKSNFKEKGADPIEGIYENVIATSKMSKYRLGLIKTIEGYNLIYISGATNYLDWKPGEIKAKLYYTATPTLFKTDWYMGNKMINKDSYLSFEKGFMTLIQDRDKTEYIKLFPTSIDPVTSINRGPVSGSGFAVASDGIIATNQHVIIGAKTIKVRGINGDFSETFNAKILIEDKNNDLALIKIEDEKFTSFGNLPFIISNKTIDVGSSIFVLGYPLRATMGDEIKLTNGIISSKSGFQGDVTTYQISAPIQPGNSGGPLFDYKGNLIGIVNARHSGAENASYAIKASYLLNLFDLMNSYPKIQTVNLLSNKPLTEQVKALKKFTYIIEVN